MLVLLLVLVLVHVGLHVKHDLILEVNPRFILYFLEQ